MPSVPPCDRKVTRSDLPELLPLTFTSHPAFQVPGSYVDVCPSRELTVLCSELGREEKARAEASELLKLLPHFPVDVCGERVPYRDPAQAERGMAACGRRG